MSNEELATPETDAARDQYQRELWSGKHQAPHTTTMVPIEFARKLERERDESRARTERIRAGIEAKISTTNIPLSAARVWVEALTQSLEVIDSENASAEAQPK